MTNTITIRRRSEVWEATYSPNLRHPHDGTNPCGCRILGLAQWAEAARPAWTGTLHPKTGL